VRGWLDAKPDPQFAEKCHDICQTYRLAPEHAAAGIPTFSIDEMTGIQALERIAQTLPVKPGRVEWREFEYTRHGTSVPSSLASTSATGEASADIDETRAEEDFAAHLAALVQQPRMHLAMDNLNTHYSESAVRLVAEHIGFEGDLGRKGRCGILRNAASHQVFLSNPDHPLGFHFTPKHASWLNQIEIWFSSSSVAATSNPRATWPAGSAISSTTSTKPWPNHSVGHIKIRPPPFDHEV